MFQENWTPTDIQFLNLLDSDHWRKFFNENSMDAILSEHVWEHLNLEDGLVVAQQCYKYLKPGCYVRVAVPDGYHPDPEYIELVGVDGSGAGADDHKVLYNFETFNDLFERAGFHVELLEYFDSDGKFNYKDWDVCNGMMHRSRRFDKRNIGGELKYISVVLDAIEPA